MLMLSQYSNAAFLLGISKLAEDSDRQHQQEQSDGCPHANVKHKSILTALHKTAQHCPSSMQRMY